MSKLIDLEGLRTFKTKFAEEINQEISGSISTEINKISPSFTFASQEDDPGTVIISFGNDSTPELLSKDSITTVNITEVGDTVDFSCQQKPMEYSGNLFDFIRNCHEAGRMLEFKVNDNECIHSYEINNTELTVFKYTSDLIAYKLTFQDTASKSKVSFTDFASSDFASTGDVESLFD